MLLNTPKAIAERVSKFKIKFKNDHRVLNFILRAAIFLSEA